MKIFEIIFGHNYLQQREYKCAFFAQHFPQLEQFKMYIKTTTQIKPIEHLTTMFRLNPQLKMFRLITFLGRPLNAIFFQNVIENLQNLEILQIHTRRNFFYGFNSNDVLYFAKVKHFDIYGNSGCRQKNPIQV